MKLNYEDSMHIYAHTLIHTLVYTHIYTLNIWGLVKAQYFRSCSALDIGDIQKEHIKEGKKF